MKQAFAWIDEYEASFQELKHYLSNPPLLSSSKEGENLYLYLAVLATTVSAAWIWEEDRKQLLVYYVSQAFQGAEAKYPRIEKIEFALIVASHKLQPYFQSTSSWMTLIISFLQDGHLLQDVEEARKIRKRVARFTILNDTLYKRGFSMPYLKCFYEEEAKYILEEIH